MDQKKISKNVFVNLLIAIAIMLYFIVINFSYFNLKNDVFMLGIKILSFVVLGLGIIFIEVAYKKDSGKIAINGIEILVLSCFTLSLKHIVEIKSIIFEDYTLILSYIFSLYYITKAVIIFTKEKKEYLKSLSDIRDIVDIKPIKKEAEKRNNKRGENKNDGKA